MRGVGGDLRDLTSFPSPGLCWPPSTGQLVLPQLDLSWTPAAPEVFFPWENCLKGPRNPSQAQPAGTKGVFSPWPGARRQRSLAGFSSLAWGPGLLDPLLLFPFQPLDGCRVRLLCRRRSQCWTLTLQQGDGCIFPALCLASFVVAGFGVTGDFVSMFLLFSPLSRVTWGTPARRSICVSEP